MRKISSFLFAFLLTTLVSVIETKASEVDKIERGANVNLNDVKVAALTSPTNLVVTVNSPTSFTITWQDSNPSKDGYLIYLANSLDGLNFVPPVTTTLNTFTFTGQAPNTTFYLDIATYQGANVSPYSTLLTFSTLKTPPAAPSNIIILPPVPTLAPAPPLGSTQLTINWTDNSNNEDGFRIYESSDGSLVNTTLIGTVGPNVTTFTHTGLIPNTLHFYVISAFNTNPVGSVPPINNVFTAVGLLPRILTLPLPPQSPFGLQLQPKGVGLNFVKIQWSNFDQSVTSFVVERSVDQNSWFALTSGVPFSTPAYTDVTDVREGITYYYRIRSINKGGTSTPSNVLAVTTLKRVPPLPPAFLVAKANVTDPQTMVDLSWTMQQDDGVTNIPASIEVLRSTDGIKYTSITTSINAQGTPAYTDKGLTPKTKYYYLIRAVNAQGGSPLTGPAQITTAGPPFAPTALAAKAGVDALGAVNVNLTWVDNADDEWSYNVERSIGDTLNFKEIGVILSNSMQFVNTVLQEGVTYYYRVRAANTYGFSKYSSIVSATTSVTKIPNAPYFLTATATAGQIALAWFDDANNETKFEVERSTDGKTFAKIGETLKNVVAYKDTSLAASTLFYYRVRAVNTLGNSGYTNVASATTPVAKQGVIFGGSQNDDSVFQVYPNPTFSSLKITLPTSISGESATIRVVDKYNREILRTVATPNSAGEIELNMSNLVEGAYTVNIQTDTQNISKRVYKY